MDYANQPEAKEALWDVEEGRYGYGKTELTFRHVREVKNGKCR
jgi:hypothetical protein